jgi:thymidylate synthase
MGQTSTARIATGAPASRGSTAGIAAGLPSLVCNGSGSLVEAAVAEVLRSGHRVDGDTPYAELLNQMLCQEDVRRRVLSTPRSSFSPAIAVARLIWHLSRRSALDAIEFYEPRARLFSDDGRVLPGSNTGARIFGGEDGVDQIGGLISRLAEDASSRRATAVVWRPRDATRASRDIPCTLAITCHLRAGALITTVTMRSNNALRLLPYNLFEFTMLAELIAVELGVEPGPYWHNALSLHVFDADEAKAAQLFGHGEAVDGQRMPPMPGPHPLREAERLATHEEEMRLAFASRRWDDLPALVAQAEAELHPYWFGLYATLASFCSKRASSSVLDLTRLEEAIPAALSGPLRHL